jgi:transcriptional regulator with XRE-family HTH domain
MTTKTITTQELGAKLRGWRNVRLVGLPELSKETGIPVSSLEIYERGARAPGGLRMIILMNALGVGPADLLSPARPPVNERISE